MITMRQCLRMVVADLKMFLVISIPSMLMLGMRHALDIDHIAAIDNLVRLHNLKASSKWVGTGFSIGHTALVLLELLLIIYVVGSATNSKIDNISLWGSITGAIALATIGATNIYSMRRWGSTGSAIFAGKIASRTCIIGPFGSSFITGLVFGLGFDTATQISAITLSALASASLGVYVALVLAGFFAIGMIPIDTLDSIILRSVFYRIFNTKAFRYMTYALSGVALCTAAIESYSITSHSDILPPIIGPILAMVTISSAFAYAFVTKNKRQGVAIHPNDTINSYKKHLH
jgi:nickel/cobalt transporter (NiCoT) family protein